MKLDKVRNEEEFNTVSYDRNVVHSIISLAAKEIGGVASLNAGVSFVKRIFGGKKYMKGIRLAYDKNRIFIDVYVNVYFGYSVNDIAYKVQENIKRSVESMTDFVVDSVSVHVAGVVFDEEQEAAVI